MIRQILEAIAEENRREIIERLWKGRQERIRKGRFPGGNVPYGYVRKNKRIVVNEQEAKMVRAIYALVSQGRTEQAISDELNRRGYLRRNGTPWTQRQVCRILLNDKLYREGIFHYGEVAGKNNTLIILNK